MKYIHLYQENMMILGVMEKIYGDMDMLAGRRLGRKTCDLVF